MSWVSEWLLAAVAGSFVKIATYALCALLSSVLSLNQETRRGKRPFLFPREFRQATFSIMPLRDWHFSSLKLFPCFNTIKVQFYESTSTLKWGLEATTLTGAAGRTSFSPRASRCWCCWCCCCWLVSVSRRARSVSEYFKSRVWRVGFGLYSI